MKVVVCIKQVPDSNEVLMDSKTGVLLRQGKATKINPSDLVALEAGLVLKDNYGCQLTALSMGPITAKEIILYSYSLGVDQGILLNDSAFAGADVYATSYTLACAIKQASFDLIICGKETTDGDTGQVGPCIATHLGLVHLYNVQSIAGLSDRTITVVQKVNDTLCTVSVQLPCVIIMDKKSYIPRFPQLKLKLKARTQPITVWGIKDMVDCKGDKVGLKGSPTRVKNIYLPTITSQAELIEGDADELATFIFDKIKGGN